MREQNIVINRQELYEQVWQKSMSKLAPKYGLSDVGLKKICKKLNIPTPPQGYWTRIQHSKRVERIPLPKLKFGEADSYIIKKDFLTVQHPVISQEAQEIIESIIQSKKKIVSVKKLTSPHNLIRISKATLMEAKPDKYNVLHPPRKEYVDIRVGPDSLTRALNIMDALIKGFERLGLKVSNRIVNFPETSVEIFGERVEFGMEETVRREEYQTNKEEEEKIGDDSPFHFYPKWDFFPTGKLSIKYKTWHAEGLQKVWHDKIDKPIEDTLDDFFINAFRIADLLRQDTMRREEKRRIEFEMMSKRQESERLRQIEVEKVHDFEMQAENWNKSQKQYAYIEEVKKIAESKPLNSTDRQKLNDWLLWARRQVERINPLTATLPFEEG